MSDRQRDLEIAQARASLSLFTPERPMMVGSVVYKAMQAEPSLADLMDRVKLYPEMKVNHIGMIIRRPA